MSCCPPPCCPAACCCPCPTPCCPYPPSCCIPPSSPPPVPCCPIAVPITYTYVPAAQTLVVLPSCCPPVSIRKHYNQLKSPQSIKNLVHHHIFIILYQYKVVKMNKKKPSLHLVTFRKIILIKVPIIFRSHNNQIENKDHKISTHSRSASSKFKVFYDNGLLQPSMLSTTMQSGNMLSTGICMPDMSATVSGTSCPGSLLSATLYLRISTITTAMSLLPMSLSLPSLQLV